MSNICIFNNDGFSVIHFRSRLIKDLISNGNTVTVLVPYSQYNSKIEDLGARVKNIKLSRFNNPISDIYLILQLYKFFKKEKFDILHNMTIKPNIYGTMVAYYLGINRIVCLVSGAGYIFSDSVGYIDKLVKKITLSLYRFSMNFCNKIWFQNQEDRDEFVNKNIIDYEKSVVIRSSGVDLQKYDMNNIDARKMKFWRGRFAIKPDDKVVLMVAARLIKAKGVVDFIEAATCFEQRNIDCKFILIAPCEKNSHDEISPSLFQDSSLKNFIYYSDFIDDIHNVIAMADIVTLPSYYREGVPRILLEAMSLSKPIITTNSIGCRETVNDGYNGFIVNPKDSIGLAIKIEELISSNDLLRAFGNNSRKMAVKEFGDKSVSKKVLSELYLITNEMVNE